MSDLTTLIHPETLSSQMALAAAAGLVWAALALSCLAWLRRRPAYALAAVAAISAAAWLSVAAAALPLWLAVLLLGLVAALVVGAARGHHRQQRRAASWQALCQQALQDGEQAALAAQAEQAAVLQRAEAADEARIRFLAAASHDLRQPATALGLHLDALRAGPLAPEQQDNAERMATALAALQGLTAALLEMSRLETGAILPRWDVVPLAPLLRRLADEAALGAEQRGLRLGLHVQDADAAAVTDALLLERVLRNLLDNALKYTREGGVLLACRRRTAADGQTRCRLEVWDTGPGVDPAHHDRIFEAYEQIGTDGIRGSHGGSGAGLGLALVRSLATQLQLNLVLHSRPGRGSVFFVEGLAPAATLPRQVAAARASLRGHAAPTAQREA